MYKCYLTHGYHDIRIQITVENGRIIKARPEKKLNIIKKFDKELWTTYSISTEKVMENVFMENGQLLPDNIIYSIIEKQTAKISYLDKNERNIVRYSYDYKPNIRIDLSQIENKGVSTYEAEVELLNVISNIRYIKNFILDVRSILCMLRGTDNLYTKSMFENVNMVVNTYYIFLIMKAILLV